MAGSHAFGPQPNHHSIAMKLNYTFSDASLLTRALTHRSCAESDASGQPFSNQRLEFLGDAVLGVIIADLLYAIYPYEQEGDLAKRYAALVRGETLAEIAKEVGLGHALILSQSEEDGGGRENPSNLEDACEALIGALYLDGGLKAAETFVHTHWQERAKHTAEPPKDSKTALQEWAQGRGLPLPEYTVIAEVGPSHAPEFTIEVSVQKHGAEQATAGNKKLAERLAADALLERLQS